MRFWLKNEVFARRAVGMAVGRIFSTFVFCVFSRFRFSVVRSFGASLPTEGVEKMGVAVGRYRPAGSFTVLFGSIYPARYRRAVAPIVLPGQTSCAGCSPFLKDLGNAFGFL